MKRSLFAAVAFATTLAIPAVAHAQMASPIKFGISAGLSLPTGDDKDVVSSGYNINGHLGFQPPLLPVGLRVDVLYNKFGEKNNDGVDLSILGGTVNGVFNLGMAPMVSPYLIGGVGLYNQKLSGGGASESKTSFGLNGGAGLRFSLSGFSTFAEARYHYVNSKGDKNGIAWDNTSFVPISFGIMF